MSRVSEAAILRAPVPPQSLTRLQLKRELEARDLWEGFKALLAAQPALEEEWAIAVEVAFRDPNTRAMGAALGFDAAGLDDLFRQAAIRTPA